MLYIHVLQCVVIDWIYSTCICFLLLVDCYYFILFLFLFLFRFVLWWRVRARNRMKLKFVLHSSLVLDVHHHVLKWVVVC